MRLTKILFDDYTINSKRLMHKIVDRIQKTHSNIHKKHKQINNITNKKVKASMQRESSILKLNIEIHLQMLIP